MIYLILAVISSVLVSFVMRISGKYTDKNRNLVMLAVNYVVCLLLACLYSGFGRAFVITDGSGVSIGLGMINGILYLAGFVLLQLNVKKNGVVMSSTFMRLGVLVPTALSVVLFGEMPSVLQLTGFVIAILAILGISLENGTEKTTVSFKAGLLLILLAGGSADAMAKVYDEMGKAELSDQFLIFTFVSAAVFCILLLVLKKQHLGWKEILFGILIAFPNYYSARFLLAAVSRIPAVVAYPSYSVGTIIVTSLMGVFFFHEHLNRRQQAALAGILVALVCLNI